MATERDLELLDDYLANRMGGEDKSAFENQLKADPGLQSELVMQQRLVKAIKDARVAELKTMLNNTPIPPVNYGGSSAVVKFAAGTVVAGLIATGVYLYMDKTESPAAQEEEIKLTEKDASDGQAATENDFKSEGSTSNAESKDGVPASKTPVTEKPSSTAEVKQPAIDVYDPSADMHDDIEEPADERKSPARNGAPSIKVQIEKANANYAFNYQFKEGRLMLFGPFEKDLYEVLEFFSAEKRTVFLYYKNNYYLLKDDNEEVQQLIPITDRALIAKLREYQKK
jgi:hypothetical protein